MKFISKCNNHYRTEVEKEMLHCSIIGVTFAYTIYDLPSSAPTSLHQKRGVVNTWYLKHPYRECWRSCSIFGAIMWKSSCNKLWTLITFCSHWGAGKYIPYIPVYILDFKELIFWPKNWHQFIKEEEFSKQHLASKINSVNEESIYTLSIWSILYSKCNEYYGTFFSSLFWVIKCRYNPG